MVVVDSDLERIDAVRVLVQGLDEPKVATADDLKARPLPRTVAVVHEGGPFGPIVVIAEAIAADNTVISRRAELSFVRGRNVMLKLHLDANCAGTTCTERGTTCIAGTCQSSKVEASELRDWSGSPDDHDGGPSGGHGGSNAAGGSAYAGRGGSGRGGSTAAGSGGVPAAGKGGSGPSAGSSGAPPKLCTDCSFASGTSQPHGELACDNGTCRLTCEAGYTDADEQRGNGCESAVSAFAWKVSNLDPNAAALKAATADSLEVDCATTVDFGSATLPATVDVCGQQLQPVLLNQPNGGSEIVVLAMRQFSVIDGAVLRFAGSRPVALVVYGDADVRGELDVSAVSTKAGAGSHLDCALGAGTAGASDGQDSAGGGGGGGFGKAGGRGAPAGTGAKGGTAGMVTGEAQLTPLRGGCPGGTGNVSYGMVSPGGAGGGALQLSVAGTLRIAGTIAAAGGGGTAGTDYGDGGGGGGSGGALLLEAGRIELQSEGWITANGGGGGEGHSWLRRYTGEPGVDGAHRSALAAVGGSGTGPGGAGAAGDSPASDAPGPPWTYTGGGGGGGGTGRIVIHAAECQIDGTSSPPVSCSPHPA
jgi:hypothetical protein